jgi:hypothetical protein
MLAPFRGKHANQLRRAQSQKPRLFCPLWCWSVSTTAHMLAPQSRCKHGTKYRVPHQAPRRNSGWPGHLVVGSQSDGKPTFRNQPPKRVHFAGKPLPTKRLRTTGRFPHSEGFFCRGCRTLSHFGPASECPPRDSGVSSSARRLAGTLPGWSSSRSIRAPIERSFSSSRS